ncbi:hypothetical protein MMC11_008285 [Xylographa trunciseda]|nr:hypothetical protein [Xylographa trunciseda]
MSQPSQGDYATEQYKVPNLRFAQDTCFDGQQKLYVVVALSQQKQAQIMKTVGQVHCHNQPFPTWSLLGQALSKALFTELGLLRLKSTMELHQKDYLLFERDFDGEFVNTSDTAEATEYILEVDFGKLHDSEWLGYWKPARPVH